MSRILFLLMVTIVFVSVLLTIAANTPFLLNKITGNLLGDYNITYSRAKGDLLSGVTAYDIKFNNQKLASKINFSWSPLSLLDKKIVIRSLTIDDLDKNTTTKLVKSFDSNSSDKPTNFEIIIQKSEITVAPFERRHYKILNTKLNAEGLRLDTAPFRLITGDISLIMKTNYGDISYKSKVSGDLNLSGSGDIAINQTLYTRYKIPLDAKNINKAIIKDLNISKDGFKAILTTSGKKILLGKTDNNNLDAQSVNSKVMYDFNSQKTTVHSTGIAQSHYAKNIKLVSDVIDNNGKTTYSGTAEASSLINLHPKLVKLLENPKISYNGDIDTLNALVDVKNFNGTFKTLDFSGGDLVMKSKNQLLIKEWLSLPASLQNARGVVEAKMPIVFKAPIVSNIEFSAKTDIVDAVGKASLGVNNIWSIDGIANVSANSILKKLIPNLKWDSFGASKSKILLEPNNTVINIENKNIIAKLVNPMGTNNIIGTITLGGSDFKVNGDIAKQLSVETKTSSIAKSLDAISKFIAFTPPKINGDMTLKATINNMQNGIIDFSSSRVIYGDNQQEPIIIEPLKANLSFNGAKWIVNRYDLKYDSERYFANKPSYLTINKDNILFEKVWINDNMDASGTYNLASKKGKFHIYSSGVNIPNKFADIKAGLDLDASVDGDFVSLVGDVRVIDGNILYYLGQKTFATDSDIVVSRDIKARQVSPFMKNLSLSLKVKSTTPIRYKDGDSNFELNVDVGVQKPSGEGLSVLGMANILDGGVFYFKGKKFTLTDSNIYFSGNIEKPILDIKATYKAPNHRIRVNVSGSPGNPIVNFSSTPKLTREQILSIIVFDSELDADRYSGDEIVKLMGGAVAKSILSDVGINVDHLVFGSKNNIEVGKKITNSSTLIYAKEEEVSKAKIKYNFSKSLDAIISVSSQSTSGDIVFKREFKTLDLRDKNKTSR